MLFYFQASSETEYVVLVDSSPVNNRIVHTSVVPGGQVDDSARSTIAEEAEEEQELEEQQEEDVVEEVSYEREEPNSISDQDSPPKITPITQAAKCISKVARKRNEHNERKLKKAKKDSLPVKTNAKSSIPFVAKSKYWAYINGIYGNWTIHELITGYQKHGFLALCLMDVVGKPTGVEQRRIDVLQQLIESSKETIEDDNLAEQTRIINTCEVTDENGEDTKSDNLRRSKHRNFPANGDETSDIITNMEQVFKHIGCIHPDTTATNSEGHHGVDVIAKLKGLGTQGPHYDFAIYLDNPEFLSWADTNTNPHKRSHYSKDRDGGSSLFINPFDKMDTLLKPNGEFIILPPYTYSILRGNVAHRGTGNYTPKHIYKIFSYFDPPNYPRLNNKAIQFKVYHFNSDTHIIRKNTSPFKHVMTEIIMPYPCVTCCDEAFFSYPYCTKHLLSECGILPFIREETKTSGCKFISSTILDSEQRLPGLADLEVMSKVVYLERYPHLAIHGVIGAIPLPHENQYEQEFVGCLTTIPYASLFEHSTMINSCNIKFVCDANGVGYFQTTKPIGNLDPIVLFTGEVCDSGLKMDTNHARLDMLNNSQRRLANKSLKGLTLRNNNLD